MSGKPMGAALVVGGALMWVLAGRLLPVAGDNQPANKAPAAQLYVQLLGTSA